MPARPTLKKAIAVVACAFVARLLFGLSREFFFEDETQIFLLGLRYYATGRWPHFGPDIVWTRSEIPGALQALLVGLPFKVLPVPEAPFVLLNLLSTASLAWFAKSVTTRVPGVPRWLVWGWLMTIPWTLQFSTHVINPSYVLPGAVLFFIGFFDAVPALRIGEMPVSLAFFLMGAGTTWVLQVHMSWPLLLPYAALAWVSRRAEGALALGRYAIAFLAGALVPGALLIPTWIRYGALGGGAVRNIHVHAVSPAMILTSLARFLSFASLEINRFIATDGAKRVEFFRHHLWLIPFAAIGWAVGIVQPIWMLVEIARRRGGPLAWRAMRWLVAGSMLIVYASYWFVIEPPQAHAFYVLAPLAFLLAAYCWAFIDSPRWRQVAAIVLAVNIAFHAGLAIAQLPELSLYKNRAPVAASVRLRQPEMFAHRRPFAIEGAPYVLSDPSRPYDAVRDMQVVNAAYSVERGPYVQWQVTVRNMNPRVAFRDLLYITTYRDDTGRVVDERHEYIKDIFEPGEVRTVAANDGWSTVPFREASFRIAAAEALLPAVY